MIHEDSLDDSKHNKISFFVVPTGIPKHVLSISVIMGLSPMFSSDLSWQWRQNSKLTLDVLRLESYLLKRENRLRQWSSQKEHKVAT